MGRLRTEDRKSKALIIADIVYNVWDPRSWESKQNDFPHRELFTNSFLMHSLAGRRSTLKGFDNFFYAWVHTFPDFSAKLVDIRQYDNTVIASIECHGTHLGHYQESISSRENYNYNSSFISYLSQIKPTQEKISYTSDITFIFQKNRVCRMTTSPDMTNIYKPLKFIPSSSFYSFDITEVYKKINFLLRSSLTNQEIDCLSLSLSGFNTRRIGTWKEISHRTVEVHLQNAYIKLDVLNKGQCVEKFHEAGSLYLWHEVCRFLLDYYKMCKNETT